MTTGSDFDLDVSEDIGRVRSTRQLDGSWDWFQRLWGFAVIAHMVGNPATGQVVGDVTILGVLSLAMGLTAVATVLRPDDRRLLMALTIMIPISAVLEAPILGNHWLLAALISLAWLVSRGKTGSWAWFATAARLMFLAFYGFAAFAKLNRDFLDSSVSCAVVYGNQMLQGAGLPGLDPTSALAGTLPYLVVGVEATVFVSLLFARTRYVGVMLGLAFHGLISFDLEQHFFDFTSVLFPLLLLWLPRGRLDGLGEYFPERTQLVAGTVLSLFVVATVLPDARATGVLLDAGFFFVWIPFVVVVIAFAGRGSMRRLDVPVRPPSATAWLLVGLVALNGLAPYLEIKTANSWNMYSNLSIVNGESNHILVPSGPALLGGHGELIEVRSTDDPGLARYIGTDWLLPQRTFDVYRASNPDVRVEYRRIGDSVTRDTVADDVPSQSLLSGVALLRAVDVSSPVQCQTLWFPAH